MGTFGSIRDSITDHDLQPKVGPGSNLLRVGSVSLDVVLRSLLFILRFLYGFPPFHADTPEKVFENILSRRLQYHEGEYEISPAARRFMEQLMCSDTTTRLGTHGADEVKDHPFFHCVDWHNLLVTEAPFIPQIADPESTDYFDPRGAVDLTFDDEDNVVPVQTQSTSVLSPEPIHEPSRRTRRERSETAPEAEDFGMFNFKNLDVLKQANDDMIRRLRQDQSQQLGMVFEEPGPMRSRPVSLIGPKSAKPEARVCIA